MRILIQTIRIIVGILFIISGLVKANDPLGLSYKMLEFFEVWTADLQASRFVLNNFLIAIIHYFHPFTLALSVVLITLEVVAGMALLVGRHRKTVLWLLMVLSVFFTFLTAYAYWSGKFKNCGCFGDCLPISPLASLLKDVALLVFIPILMAGQKFIKPWGGKWIVPASLLATLGLQWYVLHYLPLVDCLPFKKGANISRQMQIPDGARPDSFAIVFVYEKDGRQQEFTTNNLPADLSTYKYIDRRDKLIRKGNAEPPIKGFALTGLSGADSTSAVLSQPASYILFAETFRDDVKNKQALYFMQASWERKGWLLTAGGSLNDYDISFERFVPESSGAQEADFDLEPAARFAVMHRWKNLSVYSSIAKGFSPPTTSELLPTGSVINTALNPETGTNYDLGARLTAGAFRADINLFYFALKNTIVQRRNDLGTDFYTNSGNTSQKGIELSVQWNFLTQSASNALAWASFTHHTFRYRNFKQLAADYSGNRLPGVIPNVLVAGVDWKYGNWSLTATYQYNDVVALNDANTAKARPAHIAGLQAKWEIKGTERTGLQLFAGADNLFNQRYSLGYDINAFGGRYFNAAPTRNYFAGFSFALKRKGSNMVN